MQTQKLFWMTTPNLNQMTGKILNIHYFYNLYINNTWYDKTEAFLLVLLIAMWFIFWLKMWIQLCNDDRFTDVVDLEERPLYHLSDLPTQTGMAADSDKMRAIIHKLIDDIMSRPEDSSESSQNAPTKRRMMEFLGKRSPERMEGIYDNEQKRKYMEFLG